MGDVRGADPDALPPAVGAAVADALDSPTASVPVALVRATAAAVGDDAEDEPPGVPAVSAAVASLSGYAHLRRELLESSTDDRNVTLLASDYLHATAHAALGACPLEPERRRRLYATLTAGSADLATALFAASTPENASAAVGAPSRGAPAAPSSVSDGSEEPEAPVVAATLAETACALGAAVGTASRETVDAMAAYGRALVAASDPDPARLERIEAAVTGDAPPAVRPPEPGPDAERLERAREALETLPESEARRRLERATRVAGRE